MPAYTSPGQSREDPALYECGCPDARPRQQSAHFPGGAATEDARGRLDTQLRSVNGFELARPPTAHVHNDTSVAPRPMHILRAPSFNPPAFEAEEPPPALVTPPPQYDTIASPTSGLADYFARFSDAYDEHEDEGSSRSRVEVPLTPGARVNRSMDLGRTWLPI